MKILFRLKKKKVNVKKKPSRPWYTEELKKLDMIKQHNYFLYIKNKNSSFLKFNYNRSRNIYFQKVKQSKKLFFRNYLNNVKNSVRGTWKVINSVLGRESSKDLFKLKVNGNEVKNKTPIATEFNSYFSNVAGNPVKNIPARKWRKSLIGIWEIKILDH